MSNNTASVLNGFLVDLDVDPINLNRTMNGQTIFCLVKSVKELDFLINDLIKFMENHLDNEVNLADPEYGEYIERLTKLIHKYKSLLKKTLSFMLIKLNKLIRDNKDLFKKYGGEYLISNLSDFINPKLLESKDINLHCKTLKSSIPLLGDITERICRLSNNYINFNLNDKDEDWDTFNDYLTKTVIYVLDVLPIFINSMLIKVEDVKNELIDN